MCTPVALGCLFDVQKLLSRVVVMSKKKKREREEQSSCLMPAWKVIRLGTCFPSFKFKCISTSNSQCNSWLQVWAGPLSGNRLVIALWNRCSETANITMKLPAVGLDGSAAYSVRDLWKVTQKVSIAVRCGSSVHLSSTG